MSLATDRSRTHLPETGKRSKPVEAVFDTVYSCLLWSVQLEDTWQVVVISVIIKIHDIYLHI